MPPLPKVFGYKLPSSVDDGSCVSITFQFPDILEYRAAIMGSVNMLGKWFQWAHTQEDYQAIPELNQEVAQLWSNVLANASFEECMEFCEHIILCLTTDTDVQAAFREFIINDQAIQDNIAGIANKGTPITTPTEVIVESEDLDALFGAVTYLVDTMNGATLDLFEALEATTNKRELGQILFEAIPVIETLPFDEASEYIDALGGAIAENYAAQYTTTPETGMRDQLRCGLFCLARANDNTLTWELIANYFWGEVGFTSSDYVDTFVDFVNLFLSGTWLGDEIVYISFANMAAVLSTSQIFAAMTFPSLSSLMALGLNDPDPDWEILCVDCPPEPADCDDLTAGQQGYLPVAAGQAVYHNGEGYGRATTNASYIFIRKEITGQTITSVILRLNRLMVTGDNYAVALYAYDDTSQDFPYAASAANQLEYTFDDLEITDGLIIYVSSGALLPIDLRLIEVCYTYA